MIKLEIYDGTKIYIAPSGTVLTPDIMATKCEEYQNFKYVIETDDDREICYAIQLFSAMKNQMGIDRSLSDEQAISVMEEILNAPQPEPEPSAEERIAAAMEYQNLLSM